MLVQKYPSCIRKDNENVSNWNAIDIASLLFNSRLSLHERVSGKEKEDGKYGGRIIRIMGHRS